MSYPTVDSSSTSAVIGNTYIVVFCLLNTLCMQGIGKCGMLEVVHVHNHVINLNAWLL